MKFSPAEHPHRRFNPLKREWVLVSPHRNKRPWQGRTEATAPSTKPSFDAECYLCPGNTRANGKVNPAYSGTWSFENDFPALLENGPTDGGTTDPLFQATPVTGTARVLCFSDQHNLTLAELSVRQMEDVVALWVKETETLGQTYNWVAVFENKGALMGCSNPHPHGQIWASDFIPNEVMTEDAAQAEYTAKHGTPLLLDYATAEAKGDRVIASNDHWLVVVPYWATWPYETLVLPRRQILRLPETTDEERVALSSLLKTLCVKYDNLFETEFPYTMGWHGAPFTDGDHQHWQLHAHFYPPLLRSASIRKFMVGYEMLSEAQRDITAEQAAAALRDLPDIHYKAKS